MNILFTRFPLESLFGGAEVQTLSLMKSLIARGHSVSFVGSCPVLLVEGEKIQVKTSQIHIGKPPVTKLDALSFVWRKRAMKKALEQMMNNMSTMPDTICMVSLSEKILLTPFALRKGIKVLWIEHDSVGRWLRGNPWLSTICKLSGSVTTVCVSELSAEMYRSMGYKNVECIPNGVAPPTYRATPSSSTSITLGCIARLSPEKGVHVLVDAIKNMASVRLIINGKGSQKIEDSEQVQLVNRVHDIDDIYKQIDVLVLPSIENDPFGLVVAEAMLRGIPVICTTVCGVSKYLKSGVSGLVAKAGSTVALHDAIEMMQDPETRQVLSENGRMLAEKHFTVERMVDQYEELFSV
jgi:glycosyltransferase involved in cell wall biosynthesis